MRRLLAGSWKHKPNKADDVFGSDNAPPQVSEVISKIIYGNPDENWISTSIAERSNLTLRTFQRRFTRLSIGFSRCLDHLKAAVALHMAYYNFVWVPRTLKVSPGMAAGITDRRWKVADLLEA